MQGTIKKFLLGASVVAGISSIAGAPALAGSLTGASVSGVAGTDYYVYKQVGNQTVRDDSASLATVLKGSCAVITGACNPAGSPGGNVELAANSEKAGFDFTKNTTLSGTIGGKSIVLSSLTASDWNSILPDGKTLAQKWFGDLIAANNLSPLFGANTQDELLTAFVANGGLQRFSDPNISYVNQNPDGLISIGLAGHYNATSLIQQALQPTQIQLQNALNQVNGGKSQAQITLNLALAALPGLQSQLTILNNQLKVAPTAQKAKIQGQISALNNTITTTNNTISNLSGAIAQINAQIATISGKLDPLTAFLNNGNLKIQASELVKVTYNGQTPQYLYSFNPAQSGLTAADDGRSHNGEYEVTLPGDPVPVPEPSAVLGLMTVGGLFVAKRKLNKR